MLRGAAPAIVASALAVAGCSTTYTPRPGPRVSMTLDDGKPTYVRDGRKIDAGMFGDGLVEAVRGVPAAEAHAETYRDRTRSGFATTLAGAGIAVGGVVVMAEGVGSHHDDRRNLGLGVAVGGLVLEAIGAAIMASAMPHQLDALNVYNDAIEGRPRPDPWRWPPPHLAPSAAPPAPPAPPAPSAAPPTAPPPPDAPR